MTKPTVARSFSRALRLSGFDAPEPTACATVMPSMMMEPDCGVSNAQSMRAKVVLPAPLRPISAIASPRLMVSERCSKTDESAFG